MLAKTSLKAAVLYVLIGANFAFAQGPASVLATAGTLRFTENDLSPEARQLYDQQAKLIADNRRSTFDEWIFQQLVQLEAKSRASTPEKIEAEAVASASKPTEVQIKALYDGNRQSIGNRTLDEVRPNIIDYLNREAEGKQLAALNDSLKAKHKFTALKDAGESQKAAEVLATIGAKQITVGEFEFADRIELYNYRAAVHENIKGDLENAIYNKLLEAEAKKRNIDSGSLIAAEITNKLKDYTDYERMYLEDMFQARLFRDNAVKFLISDLEPQVLNISNDDDPSIGPANAKVTVVAFVDFQCSACAAFSPLMKQVISEFAGGVRLVVRDFPLTQIHDHGMDAALAGYEARQQGKFFEMGDLMYRNQDALDDASLEKYARQLGLNVDQFRRNAHSPAAIAEVKKDMADGQAYGVGGTPTIFINGVRLQRLSTSRLRAALQSALK
jgi:protein-disulfide isomerase